MIDRSKWDLKLNQYFDTAFNSLFEILPYQKVYKVKLLRSRFLRCLTPQSILEHLSFCKKLISPARFPFKCELCSPVSFMPYETNYCDHFYQNLSQEEKSIYNTLYKKGEFSIFGQVPNWFRTINSQPNSLTLKDFDQFFNEYGCVSLKIFCNSFFKKDYFYSNFPLYQFLSFCRCIFTHSKKFLLQIASCLNRKFFIIFF